MNTKAVLDSTTFDLNVMQNTLSDFLVLPFMLKYPLSDLALHVGYQSWVSTSFD